MKKGDRAIVKAMYGGRCAYCGEVLGDRWHADHVEPVMRELVHIRGVGLKPSGTMFRPERDCIENMKPACAPCNIDKHSMSLESWRQKLERTCEVLRRNNPTYRHGLRFGKIVELVEPIVFYFERYNEELGDSDGRIAASGAEVPA